MDNMNDLRPESDDDEQAAEGQAPSSESSLSCDFYNENFMKTVFKTQFEEVLAESVEVYAEILNKPISAELEEKVLVMACKVNYLDRLIGKYGEIEIDTMFERIEESCSRAQVETPFGSVNELTKFIVQMNPIFLGEVEYERPKNSSHIFREFVQRVAALLKNNILVDEKKILALVEEAIETGKEIEKEERKPEGLGKAEKGYPFQEESEKSFLRLELLTDLCDIESLAAHVPWFDYDKSNQKLILSKNHEEGLPLWLPILIPQLQLKASGFDNSRKYVVNTVILKSEQKRQKARVLGVQSEKPFRCLIKENLEDCGGLLSCEQGNKSYVTMRGCSKVNDKNFKIVGNHAKESSVGLGWKSEDLDNPLWPKRKQGFKKDEIKIGKDNNATFTFKQKYCSKKMSADLVENKARLNIVQKLVCQSYETERFKVLIEIIKNEDKKKNKIFAESLYPLYEKRFNEIKRKHEEWEQRNQKQREQKLKLEFWQEETKPEFPKVLFKNKDELLEFFKRNRPNFHIQTDSSIIPAHESIGFAINNLRRMFCDYPGGLTVAQLIENCKSRFWSNPFLESCIKRGVLVNYVERLGFVETIHLGGGDKMFVFKNDSAYYADCF